MSENKQIAKIIAENFMDGYYSDEDFELAAEKLQEAGWHKQSENIIELPCKVGSTIYRIDYREQRCSHENESYDMYYCRECKHLALGYCDHRSEVPYIFVIKDANAQTILGNEHLFGTRAFLSQEEAEQALAKMKGGARYDKK